MDVIKPFNTYYKYCVVPMCTSTSSKMPEKLFLQVPKNPKVRVRWLKAIRRNPKTFSKKSVLFVCEDHFDLENDLENYIKLKIMNWQGNKLIKKNIVPHKFKCQSDRKRSIIIPRPTTTERLKRQLIEEILATSSEQEYKAPCSTLEKDPYSSRSSTTAQHETIVTTFNGIEMMINEIPPIYLTPEPITKAVMPESLIEINMLPQTQVHFRRNDPNNGLYILPNTQKDIPIQGKRITDFMFLFDQFKKISVHNTNKNCTFFSLKPVLEVPDGLNSNITLFCENCKTGFTISLNDDSQGSELNSSAVSISELTGLGFQGLKMLCDGTGMLAMSETKYLEVKEELEPQFELNSVFIKEEEQFDDDVYRNENCRIEEYNEMLNKTQNREEIVETTQRTSYMPTDDEKDDKRKRIKRKRKQTFNILNSCETDTEIVENRIEKDVTKIRTDNCNVPNINTSPWKEIIFIKNETNDFIEEYPNS